MAKDKFYFLPSEDMIFMDTSAWGLSPKNSIYHGGNNYSTTQGYHLETAARLRVLLRKIERMENWATIDDIIEETENGVMGLLAKSRNHNDPFLAKAIQEEVYERKRLLRFIKENYRNVSAGIDEETARRMQDLIPAIISVAKKYSPLRTLSKTDINLIATTFAFAREMPVGIFSHDSLLNRTTARCAKEKIAPIVSIGIVDEEWEIYVPAKKYGVYDSRDKKVHYLRGNLIVQS